MASLCNPLPLPEDSGARFVTSPTDTGRPKSCKYSVSIMPSQCWLFEELDRKGPKDTNVCGKQETLSYLSPLNGAGLAEVDVNVLAKPGRVVISHRFCISKSCKKHASVLPKLAVSSAAELKRAG
jgi:hypothetical protein